MKLYDSRALLFAGSFIADTIPAAAVTYTYTFLHPFARMLIYAHSDVKFIPPKTYPSVPL